MKVTDLLDGLKPGIQFQAECRPIARLGCRSVEEFLYLISHFSKYALMC